MKKRPILILLIGYIIGIIMGLYFDFSIVLFYIPIILIIILYKNFYKNNKKNNKINKKKKLKLISIKRYFRYIKIMFNSKIIYIIFISSIISNSIVIFQNYKYEKIYSQLSQKETIKLTGVVISNKEEGEYYDQYKIEIKYNREKIKLYIKLKNKEVKEEFQYGDEVDIEGTYIKPEKQKNYKGFDYSKYLKQKKICGTIKCKYIKLKQKNRYKNVFEKTNKIGIIIKEKTKKVMKQEDSELFLGLLLGETSNIKEEIQENFRNASISHILAISGLHISCILIGINILIKKGLGKRKTNFVCIIILIIYMFITNFSPSITRTGIMEITALISKLIYRKNDTWTSIALSLLIILIYNPFLINNFGLQLSYGGTIGIIIFNKTISSILDNIKIKKLKYKNIKILKKLKEIISISLSVQITIFPIILYNLNTITPYFLISNLLLSLIIGPIVIISFLFIILILINIKFASIFAIIPSLSIKILTFISQIGKLPYSKIYIPTPKIENIIIYYFFIYILKNIYSIYFLKNINNTQMRMKNLIALFKFRFRQRKKKNIRIIGIAFIILLAINFIPKKLTINFIDVGQGDATLIVTPENKTVLIDGGGSEFSSFDVGKNILLPYILDRGYNKIDTVIISHFDKDHVDGILTILQELKVGKVYISKQEKKNESYKKFLKIVEKNKIDVSIVKIGDKINISKSVYFDVLWPKEKTIKENIVNNNSIVCKLYYKKFTMLFTGDIEEIAENEIIKVNNKISLNSDILKVAHHGSKTSTIELFLKKVKPKACIIGVGKDNMFGHPNDIIINRINSIKSKVYRTDIQGEINIKVNKNKKVKINSFIK